MVAKRNRAVTRASDPEPLQTPAPQKGVHYGTFAPGYREHSRVGQRERMNAFQVLFRRLRLCLRDRSQEPCHFRCTPTCA